jgi:ClpP class serine protease
VQKVADGRVFSSREALGLGLIDGIKSFVEVYDDIQVRRARETRLRTARLDAARNLR